MIVLILDYFLKGAIYSSYYNFITFMLLNFLIINLILSISSLNIIHSILFLILSFFCLSSIFFLLNLRFLGILMILIYGGAISILLLFVLMILDIKFLLFDVKISYKYFFSFFSFFLIFLFISVLFSGKSLVYAPLYIYVDWMKILLMQDELLVLGDFLYNKNPLSLFLVGIILLSVLIGSISMVTNNKNNKSQIVFDKLNADKEKLFYYNNK